MTRLVVNGQEQSLERCMDGGIQWTGASTPGKPLCWLLT
jgi:hypothetical protein